ncbi:hypothetical protein B0H19DRAFT_1369030 [Mycena capillaripes]|nr:hypothetical protein B0H19DRAFT_1369030 [Mycena capillaripes]
MPSFSPAYNPSFLQGSATAALTWVVYDMCLTFDREIQSVWRVKWSISKVLFLFSRYHTILALGFFLMEAIGTKHFTLPLNINSTGIPLNSPFFDACTENLKVSVASRSYLGMTEVLSILTGELLILLRINAVYGWSRKVVVFTLFLFCAETVIGLVTTIVSLTGGAKGLMGSQDILTCKPTQSNVPDVNIATSYFIVIFGVLTVNLLLIVFHDRYAQMGTAWLLATYSVASTRIFLNLKDITHPKSHYDATWSEFQQSSTVEFQVRSGLRASEEHEAWRAAHEMEFTRAPEEMVGIQMQPR